MYFILGYTSVDSLFLENLGGPEKDFLYNAKWAPSACYWRWVDSFQQSIGLCMEGKEINIRLYIGLLCEEIR